MSYNVIFRSIARQDVLTAMNWYDRQQAGLASRFSHAVDAALARAQSNPRQFPAVCSNPEVRRALVNRFPYRIFFVVEPQIILVIRVLHVARDDAHWQHAMQSDEQ